MRSPDTDCNQISFTQRGWQFGSLEEDFCEKCKTLILHFEFLLAAASRWQAAAAFGGSM